MSLTVRDFNRLIAPLVNRVKNMVARGVLTRVADQDGRQVVQVELLKGELRDNLERAQQYGISSHPLPGAGVFALFVGGNRDHGIILSCEDRRYRIKNTKPGEVVIYDDQGQWVHLKRDGIDISAPSGKWIKTQVGNNFIQVNKDGIDIVAKRVRFLKAD